MSDIYIVGNSAQSDIKITDEKLKIIEIWNENKSILFQIKSCIFQLALNYKDYIDFMNNYGSGKVVCNIPDTNENDYIAQQYNRFLLNFTSSYVACTEHYHKICESYNLLDQYTTLTSEYYTRHFEYRFFQKLRNFIFHNAVPTNMVNVTCKKLVCTKEYLLAQGNWNSDLQNDIQALPDEVEINLYIEKAITVLLEMLNAMTCKIFNTGLNSYESLEQFFLSINIKNLKKRIIIRIENPNANFSMVYNFEKDYNFIKSIADNQNYISELFELYINHSYIA